MNYDVVIIGGGPAGSTAGTLLRKYNPDLKVGIFERAVFPRDHVGESQLPGISVILDEMGVWDKVEAANFPIKLGATYKWGKKPEFWDFHFFPKDQFATQERPGKYEGQRRATAFQVDRAIYDNILLEHAAENGVEVNQNTRVSEVYREGDRVTGLRLGDGTVVTARHYIDASGHTGVLRRAMGVPTEYPTTLQNIAIWDYWQNAEWAVEIGVGGTYIQVVSVGYGWIWFIPLGPTRTSIGLVLPAEYYKKSGKKPAELYAEALKEPDRLTKLMKNATSEGKLSTTKDWSFISARQSGENWFLIGESAGFADPILSAGMAMAHAAGREVAYTIHELDRGTHDEAWLKEQFDARQSLRIRNHIRFGDYWYTANEQFKDLKEYTTKIAHDAELELSPEGAWDWLARGGFVNDDATIGTGGFSITALKALGEFLAEVAPNSPLQENNVFKLDLSGASYRDRARYTEGRIVKAQAYTRGDRMLPLEGVLELLMDILQRESRMPNILARLNQAVESVRDNPELRKSIVLTAIQGLEAMVNDGWVKASYDPALPLTDLRSEYMALGWNTD